ncbi:hypothetical protein DSO57_1013772 [Entomophthora muscae]|uniref:Uncharacterized protein n=1 Tax=Entomophthora muscae TaxID=34485 RepID=A0ACC2S7M8_9FUNG|nr:hypothetical protein DSO57_1013772 [Entomophthora muscae]
MRGSLFLFWLLASFLSLVLTLENPTPTIDWYNSSPDNAHQKESLAHGWFKYPSDHWGRKFQYGCSFTLPPPEPSLVIPYASFYLLTYVVGYYMLGCFSSMFGRFAYLSHLGQLAIIMGPIGSVIAGLNLGALSHQLGNLFPAKWVPDIITVFYNKQHLIIIIFVLSIGLLSSPNQILNSHWFSFNSGSSDRFTTYLKEKSPKKGQSTGCMATPHQETFLPIPKGDTPNGYVIYQDHLHNASVTLLQLNLSQRMLYLQLESFAGGVKGDVIVSWLYSTKTHLCICQVNTASGCLTGPTAVWFTNWTSQEIEITWVLFSDAVKSRNSETFSPIMVGTPLLAIKQTRSVPEYLASQEAVTDGNTMLLILIINGLNPHVFK